MTAEESRKRQQPICYRRMVLPRAFMERENLAAIDESASYQSSSNFSAHFLPALQLVAHVIEPLRKGLVHFYVTSRDKEAGKPEIRTLLSLGRLFRNLITGNTSSSTSLASGVSGSSSGAQSAEDIESALGFDLPPVETDHFFTDFYKCLRKFKLTTKPMDVTEAIQVLLQCIEKCCSSLPLTSPLFAALLDKACMGFVMKQKIMGQKVKKLPEGTREVHRISTQQMMMWCPHELTIKDLSRIDSSKIPEDSCPTLDQLIEADCEKRPLQTTPQKSFDFDKESWDMEFKVVTTNGAAASDGTWKCTRLRQLSSLTGYLFVGINRKLGGGKMDYSRLEIPTTMDLTKLCVSKKEKAVYDLVGGILYDDGDYAVVLKNQVAADALAEKKAAKPTPEEDEEDSEDEEDQTWILMEPDENLRLSESFVLDFLTGSGNKDTDDKDSDDKDNDGSDDDDDSVDENTCGTLAVYKLRSEVFRNDMNTLLSDIVISHIQGKLISTTDYIIEEEFEEEIIEEEVVEE